MRIIFLLLIFNFIRINTYSQNQVYDSLLAELAKETIDSCKTKLNIELGHYLRDINTDSAKYYYTEALKLSEQIQHKKFQAISYNGLGNMFRVQGKYKESKNAYNKAINVWKQIGDSLWVCKTLSNIGNIYWTKGELAVALDFYLRALKIAEDLGDKRTYTGINVNMGLINQDIGNKEKALQYYKKALVNYEELNIDWGKSICYINIGTILLKEKKLDEAIVYFNKGLEIDLKENNLRGVGLYYNNLGIAYKDKGEQNLALNYFYKGDSTHKVLGNKKGIASSNLFIAEIAIDLKDYKKCLKHTRYALEIGLETETLDIQSHAYEILSKVYAEKKQYADAYKYHKKFKQINDSIFTSEKSKQIIELQAKFENEKKEKENKMLKIENKLHSAEIEKQRSRSYVLYSSIAFLLVLFLSSYKRMHVKKKANTLLEDKNKLILKQQDELSDALVKLSDINEKLENQKEELNTQAEVLSESNATKDKFLSIIAHDLKNPFNSILGLTDLMIYNYDSLSAEKQKKYIKAINTSAGSTYNLLSNLLVWAKSQSNRIELVKEDLNLLVIMDNSIQPNMENAKTKGISVNNNISEDWTIKGDKYTLTTVFGNLFSNAVKFTKNGGNISLNAILNNGFHEIEIKDSGIGMSENTLSNLFNITNTESTEGTNKETGSGLGLILCKEFIEKNNGRIEVESTEGKGSCFTVYIPS